jgi:transcriptional regulator with XRE-family HTH domain
MIIGDRLRDLRELKGLSQGEMEKRTGLLRCYISRVENGHTTPAVETLEKIARALEVPMYAIFYDGERPPRPPQLVPADKDGFGASGRERQYVEKLCQSLALMKARDLKLLMHLSQHLAGRKG